MSVTPTQSVPKLLALTAQIAASYFGSNRVEARKVPGLVTLVHRTLASLETGISERRPFPGRRISPGDFRLERRISEPGPAPPPAARPNAATGKPAARKTRVDPRKSVFPGYILCLDCGKRLKTLRRHLDTTHKMSPAQYRAKHDLPVSYPTTAPDYAKVRSKMAKAAGFGRRTKRAA